MRALIVENEEHSREFLRILLNKYCSAITSIYSCSDGIEAQFYLQDHEIEILFLDIEMPKMTGFEFLSSLGSFNFHVIFVTGYSQYAIKAIKYHALDYILKPIDIDELQNAVNKAKVHATSQIEYTPPDITEYDKTYRSIIINAENKKIVLNTQDIIYCKAEGSYTWIHCKNNQSILATKNLGAFEDSFKKSSYSGHYFIRPHNSYVVNALHIKSVASNGGEIELTGGIRVPVSQRKKKSMLNQLKSQWNTPLVEKQ